MSANDILDVLNVQRDQNQQQPAKKKQRVEHVAAGQKQMGGMARELYNLLGPNTPPINLNGIGGNSLGGIGGPNSNRMKPNARPSPWSRMEFKPQNQSVGFNHWMKGSKELLESEEQASNKGYFFDKFNTKLSLPELVDQETYEGYLKEFKDAEIKEKERIALEKRRLKERAAEKQREREEKEKERIEKEKSKQIAAGNVKQPINSANAKASANPTASSSTAPGAAPKPPASSTAGSGSPTAPTGTPSSSTASAVPTPVSASASTDSTKGSQTAEVEKTDSSESKAPESSTASKNTAPNQDKNAESQDKTSSSDNASKETKPAEEPLEVEPLSEPFTYDETVYLFDLCNAFELKWPIIADRYTYPVNRSSEDLKEHFYRVCYKILEPESNTNPNLLESLKSFSKTKEVERKHYLENLLKRTPAEIAEEESLVIEARRFELAAKKMLLERSYLLNLLDSPQTSQSVQQYQSSQGLATLYNNLMIIDKHQKKRQQQLQQKQAASGANGPGGAGSSNGPGQSSTDPVPPAIPQAASSSFKKERTFQTHLQQYLSGVLKQQGGVVKGEPNPIQQLLSKRLTVKEEEAYGLHYHANEKINPGVTLRSTQKLPGLQQRQSVLKSVNSLLQEMDIPTAGGTNWKPVMPTRKTMSKYDTLLRAVVALLDVKKGKDKLESEIKLIKSQRNL